MNKLAIMLTVSAAVMFLASPVVAMPLDVYSVDGRLVRTLVEGHAGPGPVEVSWDGLDGQGRRVGSGLYFIRLVAGNEVRRGKLVVLR